MNMLLQILEEGKLTDSFGRQVDFRNTIILLTSTSAPNGSRKVLRWASPHRTTRRTTPA